ncbi:flavin reductase family protein [Actinokineospora sp. NPDC004072]
MPDRIAPEEVREDDFRALMAGFPTGVAVVTALAAGGIPWGMTCSAVCSVTVEPPTLLVCLRSASPTLAAVTAAGAFAVNLLDHDARRTAELFASGDPRRFDRVEWTVDAEAGGPHLREDAHSVADCAVARTEPIGDHTIVIGTVTRVLRRGVRRPLLYGLRSYSAWPEPANA